MKHKILKKPWVHPKSNKEERSIAENFGAALSSSDVCTAPQQNPCIHDQSLRGGIMMCAVALNSHHSISNHFSYTLQARNFSAALSSSNVCTAPKQNPRIRDQSLRGVIMMCACALNSHHSISNHFSYTVQARNFGAALSPSDVCTAPKRNPRIRDRSLRGVIMMCACALNSHHSISNHFSYTLQATLFECRNVSAISELFVVLVYGEYDQHH
jgi:hypothetical protein